MGNDMEIIAVFITTGIQTPCVCTGFCMGKSAVNIIQGIAVIITGSLAEIFGFFSVGVLMEALRTIISIHEPRFYAIVNDLTDHQLSLLLAVLDGVVRFSASDVIEKYRLNSSANVRRVKDALKKKEVITFNEKDEPIILDPLFEYWVSNNYFERR